MRSSRQKLKQMIYMVVFNQATKDCIMFVLREKKPTKHSIIICSDSFRLLWFNHAKREKCESYDKKSGHPNQALVYWYESWKNAP